MQKSTTDKVRDLIPYFSTVLGIVTIVLLWNLIGCIFGTAHAITWLFQVFFTAAAIYLGLFQAVQNASNWFLSGLMSVQQY